MLKIRMSLFFVASIFFVMNFASARSLKVINQNVWHGWTQKGIKTISIEPQEQKEKRIAIQIKAFKASDADLIFLQEVDPAASQFFKSNSLSKRYAKSLNMDYIKIISNCGIKLGGYGFPKMYSGLAILAKKDLNLKKVKGINLSRGGFCTPILSFQIKESRYALLGQINLDGKIIYVGNTHLHHGFNANYALPDLGKMVDESQIDEKTYAILKPQVLKGHNRRLKEVNKLMKKIKHYIEKNSSKLAPLILGGDFNDRPSSETVETVLKNNMSSVSKNKSSFYTWNPEINTSLDNMEGKFDFPYHLPKSVRKEEKENLLDVFEQIDRRKRQIDYIFISNDLRSSQTKLFNHKSKDGIFPSDHFGIFTVIDVK